MKHLILLVTTIFFMLVGITYAEETNHGTNSDLQEKLQAEVDGYIAKVGTLRGDRLIQTADLITGAGLSDARLYSAVESKVNALVDEHQTNPKGKMIAKELNAMMRALGSMDPKSKEIISNLLENSTSRGIRNRAVRLLPKLNWFAKRNKVMQKPDFYQPGQDLMTYRYLNLITSDDPQISRWGAEEINRSGGAEQVVFRKMAEIIDQQKLNIRNDIHLDSLAWFCKILRKFDLSNSRELLNSIRNNPSTHKKLKKYSKV